MGIACISAFLQSSPVTLTQHKINELAGKCFNAQYALSGLKGSKKQGETDSQFSQRIKSYLSALDEADKALMSVKQPPLLAHGTSENEKAWKDIALNANKLDQDIHEAHSAWAAVPRQGEKAKLGPKLLQALNTVQAILTALRDAKP